MSRPEFLNCIMTPEIIRSIRQDQEYYDEDPERYEQQERERKERRLQEQEEMEHQRRLEEQRQQEDGFY